MGVDQNLVKILIAFWYWFWYYIVMATINNILLVLENNSGKCLDNGVERLAVANALMGYSVASITIYRVNSTPAAFTSDKAEAFSWAEVQGATVDEFSREFRLCDTANEFALFAEICRDTRPKDFWQVGWFARFNIRP